MDVYPGSVALHNDAGGSHVAVILTVNGDSCDALFFTSKPNWADRTRRATREELAMAGYVHSRTTYLAYVNRPRWDFEATELTYPLDWVQSLRREFCPTVSRLIEVTV